MLGVITVNYYSEEHTEKFVDSISDHENIEIVIIDNSNSLTPIKNTTIIKPETNIGLSRAWKLGFNYIKNKVDVIIFSNNDAVLSTEFINYCKNIDTKKRIIFGPKIMDLKGNVWSAGGNFQKPFYNVKHSKVSKQPEQIEIKVEHLSGCIWAIPKKTFSNFNDLIVDNFFFRGEEWFMNLIAERMGIQRKLINYSCFHDENGSHERFSLKYLYFLYRAKWVFYNLSFGKTKGATLNYIYIIYQIIIGIPKFTKKSDSSYYEILNALINSHKLRNKKIITEDEFVNNLP